MCVCVCVVLKLATPTSATADQCSVVLRFIDIGAVRQLCVVSHHVMEWKPNTSSAVCMYCTLFEVWCAHCFPLQPKAVLPTSTVAAVKPKAVASEVAVQVHKPKAAPAPAREYHDSQVR